MLYKIGFAMQISGLLLVGICFVNGMIAGDYTMTGLYQFLGGSIIFYIGHSIRIKAS